MDRSVSNQSQMPRYRDPGSCPCCDVSCKFLPMTSLSKCLAQVSALVFGGWLLVTPPGNDVTRPQKEWQQERSFETLQQCATYRERQADGWIKRMETVPEGSPDYETYDHAVTRFLLGKCILTESAPRSSRTSQTGLNVGQPLSVLWMHPSVSS